ncbi:hypothetical protein MSPP1_000415 [Malassezia sp. CBS 17886]|nr:hypothetical protein MSPP1_000415 [Malassezia sp. CBS 17886]
MLAAAVRTAARHAAPWPRAARVSVRTLTHATDRVRRALLYVPGSAERMLVKVRRGRHRSPQSHRLPADTLVYDLEDSVADHRKGAARELVLQVLCAAPRDTPELAVRINAPSVDSALATTDLDVVLPSQRLQALVVPKVETLDDVTLVAQRVLSAQSHSSDAPLALLLSVESACALVHLAGLLPNAQALLSSHPFNGAVEIAALVFASEDYCAATGIRRTPTRSSLLYPRSHIVTVAKAFGLQAIDMVCIDYKDAAYLAEECEDGAGLGFDGKQAIHPSQLAKIRRAFEPSEKELAEAHAILDAHNAAREQHRGAVGLELSERMVAIDAPMLLQAHRTIERAKGMSVGASEKAGERQ